MGDIADWFDREEFACKCGCGFDDIDLSLVRILDDIREYFGRKMTITSGCRCENHNKNVNGAPKSWHIKGMAADVKVEGIAPQLVAEAAAQFGAKGIKTYSTWTHIDTRTGPEWRE